MIITTRPISMKMLIILIQFIYFILHLRVLLVEKFDWIQLKSFGSTPILFVFQSKIDQKKNHTTTIR